jgi:hypothetical protein
VCFLAARAQTKSHTYDQHSRALLHHITIESSTRTRLHKVTLRSHHNLHIPL